MKNEILIICALLKYGLKYRFQTLISKSKWFLSIKKVRVSCLRCMQKIPYLYVIYVYRDYTVSNSISQFHKNKHKKCVYIYIKCNWF